ncbi:MAG: FGGY-family carbohydrate kinase, partial [Spirochaetia bacterium]|nr:FGGY-family carbohydrate kinase [Spirochaetia bacterium]
CTEIHQAKNTYGTGCFLLYNTGNEFILSKSGLITTLACDAKGNPVYALEGSIFIGGAVIQWLRDYMKFFADASETDELIEEVEDEDDELVFVPAFVGLGAPHWDMKARGGIFGITRDTSPARITRAAVKSIALQTRDVIEAMEKDTGEKIKILKVDGGAAFNHFLLKYQAGILNRPVERPQNLDTTALGAAYLAGLECGLWENIEELRKLQSQNTVVHSEMTEEVRNKELSYWQKGVKRVMGWKE